MHCKLCVNILLHFHSSVETQKYLLFFDNSRWHWSKMKSTLQHTRPEIFPSLSWKLHFAQMLYRSLRPIRCYRSFITSSLQVTHLCVEKPSLQFAHQDYYSTAMRCSYYVIKAIVFHLDPPLLLLPRVVLNKFIKLTFGNTTICRLENRSTSYHLFTRRHPLKVLHSQVVYNTMLYPYKFTSIRFWFAICATQAGFYHNYQRHSSRVTFLVYTSTQYCLPILPFFRITKTYFFLWKAV